jgi:enediyne biosynthesis protein E4
VSLNNPSAPSGQVQPPRRLPLSPRRRRLRLTVALLLVAATLGAIVGAVIYLKSRPRQYRPDESEPEITSSLARKLPPEASRPSFTDVTRPAGLADFRTFIGDRSSQLPEDMGAGVAWGDFDNDGLEDLFVVSGGGPLGAPTEKLAPCVLYKNMGDGTFRQVQAFPELRIHGMAAAWGDYDDDGYLDLIVTGYNTLLLLHNEQGTGKFTVSASLTNRPGFWSSAAWGDYDNDRRLDLYICGYVAYNATEADRTRASAQLGTAVPYTLNPSSFDPIPNLLFHNNGDGTFTEVAEKLGVSNPKGRSLGALWHDFDDDGWLDLYIANDISDNAFYHNKGGTFEDSSYSACVADYRSAMGLAAGDWSRKGYDDLFISHWIGQQFALYHNLWADLNPTNSTSARPFGLRFMDLADIKGLGQISLPCIGWGTEFFDFDNDGWLDLVVVNGSTLEADGPAPKQLQAQAPFLFWNQRGEYLHNVAPLSKPLGEKHVARGLGVADYNQDGALDLVVSHLGEGVQLLRNDLHTGNWIEVRLRSRTSKGPPVGFGDGSTVIAHVGGAGLRRSISSASYLSQSSRMLHFGLGAATKVEQMEVRWHAGATNFFANLDANSIWEITEGNPTPRRIGSRTTTSLLDPGSLGPSGGTADERARLRQFWDKERAAMDAMKTEQDLPKAITLFHAALELNPQHEDSHYYLGQCLAAQGDITGALAHLQTLTDINPQSHRGFQQWGTLRALHAQSDSDLAEAEDRLLKAHALNPEETGALLVLGQVALLRGDLAKADERLAAACRTNPRAVGGFFLRGYLAWQRGDTVGATKLLAETRQALGKEWHPQNATAEGDVKRKQFVESTPLSRFWEQWDGANQPAAAFGPLAAFLSHHSSTASR